MERKKSLQKRHGVVKRVFSLILAFAMVITMTQFAPGGVTAKADDNTVRLYFELPSDTVADDWVVNCWGGATVTGGAEHTVGGTWTTQSKKSLIADGDDWGYVEVSGSVEGFQFVKWIQDPVQAADENAAPQVYNCWESEITAQNLTEAYYDPGVNKWYKEAEKTNEIKAAEPPKDCTVTLHYHNTNNWDEVAVYLWNPSELYGAWPGMLLTEEEDHPGWYSFETTQKNNLKITGKFNNNNKGRETDALNIDIAGETEVEAWCSGNGADLSYDEPDDYTNPSPLPDKYEGPAEITVHFKNDENWDNVYAYLTNASWGALAGYAYTATWPGAEVEADSKNAGWYSFTINIDAQPINLILNNNDKKQTDTIAITPTAAKTEKWVTGSTATDVKPDGWTDSTSNPPVEPSLGYVSPEVDGRKVTFRYKSDTAKTVQLAGTMTDWGKNPVDMKKGKDGIWSVERQLSPGAYQYKFIVDGSNWILDPANKSTVPTSDGGSNSKVVVTSLADAKMYAEKGVATDLPTLKFYGEDGTLQNLAPTSVNYELAEDSQSDSSYVTIAGGKITVASGFTGKSVKLKATYDTYESTVTVNVVDKLYEYTIYYYDFTASHMSTDASALWIWTDGVSGTEYWFTGTEELTKDGDANTWLKATVKVPFTKMEIIPKNKSEDADAPEWAWQETQKHFENIDKNDTATIYLINWNSTAYTELPEPVPPRDRCVVVEYDRPAGDYTGWNIFSWNTGFGSGTELYSEEINGKHYITVPVADYTVDLNLSFCMRRTEEDNEWADKDGGDHFVLVPSDQTVVKARFVQDKGITEILPYNTGYEMDGENDQIHFYYRDDDLFRVCTLANLDGKVQIVVNDGDPVSMEYDAKNERYCYDYSGLEEGDYTYYYLVNGEKVLDAFNPRTTGNGSASVLTYKSFDADISASVKNSTMDYNDNNVLSVDFTGADADKVTADEIALIQADLSALGFGIFDIDPQLRKGTIACLQSVPAGAKTIPVTLKDIYGHTYTATATVTVEQRVKAAGDFDWDEAVIYFAVTDRFFDGNTSNNDAYGVGDYDKGDKGGSSYHGGDFAGLTQKLDYLKELGVNTIWITPIVENITEDQHDPDNDFATYGYHGYWASDFEALNRHLGTPEEFKALLDAAHSRNMKIMVDVVLNHAGYGTEGYFNGLLSDENGDPLNMIRDGSNTVYKHDQRDSLSGLPDFVTENAAVRDQLVEWQTEWMDKFDIDYYRVDTVKHVENTTWAAFKNSLTEVNPEFKMIGEYAGAGYANTAGTLGTGMMDALLDFDFNGWTEDFVTGKISDIEKNLVNRNAVINNTATMGSFLSSHDEDSLQALLMSEKKLSAQEAYNLMKVSATLQITAKGQPIIYYGEEIGQAGKNDWPYQTNRRDFDWAELERQKSDPNSIYNHYKTMLAIRNAYTDVFARGTRTTIDANDAEGYDIISRSYNGVTLYVGMNIKDTAKEVAIPVNAGRAGSAGAVYTNLYDGKQYTAAADGKVTVTIPAAKDGGTVVLVAKKTTQGEVQGEQENLTQQGWYDGWAGVSPEQKAKLMRESLAQNAAVTAPKTNDNAPIAMVIMLLMTGAVAVAGAVGKKRKLS